MPIMVEIFRQRNRITSKEELYSAECSEVDIFQLERTKTELTVAAAG